MLGELSFQANLLQINKIAVRIGACLTVSMKFTVNISLQKYDLGAWYFLSQFQR